MSLPSSLGNEWRELFPLLHENGKIKQQNISINTYNSWQDESFIHQTNQNRSNYSIESFRNWEVLIFFHSSIVDIEVSNRT